MAPVVSCSDDVDLLGIGGYGCDVEGIVVRFGVDRDSFPEECLLCILVQSDQQFGYPLVPEPSTVWCPRTRGPLFASAQRLTFDYHVICTGENPVGIPREHLPQDIR